ncbi:MAG: class I SAM-dependent methyltransferase [bacterium]|nr:class I SAM-dependent methyltransferase [bacterium]
MILKDKSAIKRYLHHLGPKVIDRIRRSEKLADFGCAEGRLLEVIEEHFGKTKENLYGFDVSESFVAEAKKAFPNVYYLDLSRDEMKERGFDVVFAFDIIEHLENPDKFLENIVSIMKNKGLLILSTPNINSLSHLIQKSNWFAFKDKTHKVLYSRSSLFPLLERFELKTIVSKTISDTGFPLYNKIISLTSLGGQILLAAEKKQ